MITELAQEAGAIALGYFNRDPEVWMKEGESPVSEADFAVDRFLKEKLLAARPDYGWLSEESEDTLERIDRERIFVVDPIDGTRGFINGQSQWCVSIAVVEKNRPVAGVLECPALGETIFSTAGRDRAFLENEGSGQAVEETRPLQVAGPRSLGKAIRLESRQPIEIIPFVPSLAYRLAMVADQRIDLALARASAKDWDLAAADLILQEAGAKLTGLDGQALRYNERDVRQGALVASKATRHNEMLDLARTAMDKHQK